MQIRNSPAEVNNSNSEQNETYFAVEADYIASMGVFMTASEANGQRVFKLVLVEREQMWGQFTTADKESPAIKRGKAPMSETRQLWISNSLSRRPCAFSVVRPCASTFKVT
jgi:hypothetical protein